jgi:hypothetical protein
MRTILALALTLTTAVAAADEVRLINGDMVSGEVKSLDGESLVLASENFGELKIDRKRIATIRLGDAPPPAVANPVPGGIDAIAPPPVDPQAELESARAKISALKEQLTRNEQDVLKAGTDAARSDLMKSRSDLIKEVDRLSTRENELLQKHREDLTTLTPQRKPNPNDDLVEQLRKIDPGSLKAVEQAFPLLNSSPEAKKYFTDRVGGLMSGKVKIDDVRNDAKKVMKELEELKADLGDQSGAALDGYLSILNKFLDETEPDQTKVKPARPIDPRSIELESPQQLQQKIDAIERELKESLEKREEELKKALEP